MGCCQTSIPKGLDYYNVTLHTFHNHTSVWPFNRCGYAFLGEKGSFVFHGVRDLYDDPETVDKIKATVPVVLDWVIAPKEGCSESAQCKGNSSCYDVEGGGYRCRCNDGFEGNPYLDPGCQDINECQDPVTNPCYGDCINTPGSYNCVCPQGSVGDAKIKNGCEHQKDSRFSSTTFIIAMVFGVLAILSGIVGIIYGIRRRKLMKLREKFFEQNGGVLLKQKINSQGSHKAMILFSTAQLRKATRNYSKENIIGRGAYGVVYKGVLPDTKVVAIKKSKIIDESQAEQFINELLILKPEVVGDLVTRCLKPEGRDRPTMKEVVVELDNLRKFTTHPWYQQQTFQDNRSLVLEVEQSDLFEVPLVSYGTNNRESYPDKAFEENKPR